MKTLFLSLPLCLILSPNLLGEALEEVNLQRKSWGQKPLIKNERLTEVAHKIAKWQAHYQINLDNGYNGHEMRSEYRLPNTSIGTGVSSSYGWSSCLMEVYGSYQAGAGVAIGTDGKRYMVLVLKGKNHPGCRNDVRMIRTRHLTPDAPMIPRSSLHPEPQPGPGIRYIPKDYSSFPGPLSLRGPP